MTVEEFIATLSSDQPPELSRPLLALWHDGRGEWNRAHSVAQEIDDDIGAWVHAYLHRKEGDLANAAYWYRNARQTVATDSLPGEWTRIVTFLLGREPVS